VRVVAYTRRHYPQKSLAANLIGHVSTPAAAQVTQVAAESGAAQVQAAGLVGIEKQFEPQLAGSPGAIRRLTNRRGELLKATAERRARAGGDVILTIDAQLQEAAEQLLERFDQRQFSEPSSDVPHGGALLVMDVRSGEMLAAASQPRFDPNWFATGDPRLEAALSDPGRPMFDRALRMELPPGSVFKPLVALALLEHGVVREDTAFRCQGYVREPDRMRCQIFREHGIGHGEINLTGALAQSCNVFFFKHAATLGPEPLVAWARRFGFGAAGGNLPLASELRTEEQVQSLAIGQGTLTATPLQVLRLYAAIANGGYLVDAKFTREQVAPGQPVSAALGSEPAGARVAGLDPASIAAVRRGLEAVVAQPAGTAFATVRTPGITIAGKTGTAQAGVDRPDHAWFAGYVPADEPRYGFVVVLEHGGSGSTAAGTIARHLVEQLERLDYLGRVHTASEAFPPGKG
jgi:penicillin-binding protein 2